jgi:hypothetical protein
VAKIPAADERAVHALRTAGVGPHLARALSAKDKDLIRRLVAQSLDAQINDIVTTEAGPDREIQGHADCVSDGIGRLQTRQHSSQEFDKLWLPKAPQIAELRKAGASLA